MALNVWTKNCAPDAEIRKDGSLQYEVGVTMMVLGVDEITDKNLDEVVMRWRYYSALNGNHMAASYAAAERALVAAKGVEVNVNRETWLQFSKRIAKNWHDAQTRNLRYEKSAKETPADDELDPREWEG